MRKLTFIAIAWLFMSQFALHAQGLYFGLGGGYGMPSGLADNSYHTNSTYTSSSISLGSGADLGVYVGYMMNKNIGLELGISDKFVSGATTTSSDTGSFGSSNKQTFEGGMLRFTPAIRLQTGDGNIKVYSVTGLVIGMPMSVTNENVSTPNSSFGSTTDDVITYSGGISIGFHGALGVLYMINDKIGIFGELSAYLQNWSPGEGLYTKYTVNGVDELGQMTTNEKQTNYVSSYTQTGSPSAGSPNQSTFIYLPYSSFGLNVGIHFSLASSK